MSPTEGLPSRRRKRIETFVNDCLLEDEIPGMSVALVSSDGIVYENGFGARKLATNEPMTPDTLYGVGSCTKSFTALAVMQLAEAGELDVDDPVSDHVDRYEDAPGDPITIRELLCHRSGLPSDAMAVALIERYVTGDSTPVPLSDDDDFARHVEGSLDRRAVERDDPFFYYNSGYTVLGEVVEAASGQSYREYVGEEILDPLDMARSTFEKDAVDADADAITGYYEDDGGLVAGSFPHDRLIDAPGGLLSSVREMANYLRMQMAGGSFEGDRLVSEAGVEAMHEPHATREDRLDGSTQEYGYGWMIQDFLDDRLVEHGGSIGVSTGYAGFLESAGLGIAVGCNVSPSIHPMYVGAAVLALASGREPTEVPFFALREKARRVAGEYESYRGLFEATVEREGGTLTLSTGDQRFGLVPASADPDDWTYETVTASGAKTVVEFEERDGNLDCYFQRWRLRQTE